MATYPIPQGATSVVVSDPAVSFVMPQPPTNQPPTCNAGSDVTITLPVNTVSLQGRGSDPDGNAISFLWTQLSGASASILSPQAANTDVILSGAGVFVFRLTVTDSQGAKTTDEVQITVNSQPTPPPSGKYEGFGKDATGGTTVVPITSKADFDNAVNNPNGKILKFMQDIKFTGRYEFTNKSYFTIDCNGFDVTIDNNNNGDGVSVGSGCHHIIITGLRVINAGNDGINVVDGAHDIVIDHCSGYDNRDGNIDIAGDNNGQTSNITVQWCLMLRGKTGWSGDTLVTGKNVSIHHCLYAPATSPGVQERCPFIHANYSPVGSPNCDFRNNLIYGWGRYASGIGYKATANFVNNYYASNKSGAIDPNADSNGNTSSNHGWYYVAGNVQIGGSNINLNGGNHTEWVIPDPYKVTTTDAVTAGNSVLQTAGTARRNVDEKAMLSNIIVQ